MTYIQLALAQGLRIFGKLCVDKWTLAAIMHLWIHSTIQKIAVKNAAKSLLQSSSTLRRRQNYRGSAEGPEEVSIVSKIKVLSQFPRAELCIEERNDVKQIYFTILAL